MPASSLDLAPVAHAAGASFDCIGERGEVSSGPDRPSQRAHVGVGRPALAHAVQDATHAVTIEGLTATTCRWPLGGARAPAMLYCGAEAPADRPYCEHHRKLATSDAYARRALEWAERQAARDAAGRAL